MCTEMVCLKDSVTAERWQTREPESITLFTLSEGVEFGAAFLYRYGMLTPDPGLCSRQEPPFIAQALAAAVNFTMGKTVRPGRAAAG